MKFIHLADLHLGKRVNEFPMLPDQNYLLDQIFAYATEQQVDAVVIAGDVFDKAVPSVEALQEFEAFLLQLADANIPVCAIAGNHDSAERLSFGSLLMQQRGIHIARRFTAAPQQVVLHDAAGVVVFHLLPFVKPVYVREAFPDEEIASYDDAVRVAVQHMQVDASVRNVLVAHQFVTNAGHAPETCESETVAIGGVDNVDASLFDAFDYVALGHLHGRQSILRPEVRYCGSPLKYSFSEATQKKSLTMVDLDAAGAVSITELPLHPLHDLREVTGSFEQLRTQAAHEGAAAEDYLHVTLTDDHLMDAMAKVREFYPNVMKLDFNNAIVAARQSTNGPASLEKSLPQLFCDFLEEQLGEPVGDAARELVNRLAASGEGDAQ